MSKTDNTNTDETKVGVLVGRFEVAYLTDGHRDLLNYMLSKKHTKNIIILGNSPIRASKKNPLDFDTRRRMIEAAYPDSEFIIMYINDVPSDELWSKNLDGMLDDIRGLNDVVLYGSRDSFINRYSGKFKDNFEEFEPRVITSGSEQRKRLGKLSGRSADFRAGCIFTVEQQYPTVHPTVDCAIFKDEFFSKIILAKKCNEDKLRFIGGFADPSKDSYNGFESTAKREALEETGCECDIVDYVCSEMIDDWRYRYETNKIITTMFAMKYSFGKLEAHDDICELHIKNFDDLTANDFVAEHRVLFERLSKWREKYVSDQLYIKKAVAEQLD